MNLKSIVISRFLKIMQFNFIFNGNFKKVKFFMKE